MAHPRRLLPSMTTICVLLLGLLMAYHPSHAIVPDISDTTDLLDLPVIGDILDTELVPNLGDVSNVPDVTDIFDPTTLVPDLGGIFSFPTFPGATGETGSNWIIAFALIAIAAIGGVVAAAILALA